MRWINDMNYGLLSHHWKKVFVHQNQFIPFYPVVIISKNLIQHYKAVSIIPSITIFSFNPTDETQASGRLPDDSLQKSGNETTIDLMLTDRHQNSKHFPDKETLSPSTLDIFQEPSTTTNDWTKLAAIFCQRFTNSQFRTTRRLRRKPVKNNHTNIPASEV